MRQPLTVRTSGLTEFVCRPKIFAPLLLCLAGGISAWLADSGPLVSDEGFVLAAAAKLLRGAVFYREVDAYQFPGAFYLLALWMRIFGEHLSAARWLAVAVYCCTVLSLYAISLHLLERKRAALFALSLLSFKFLAWPAFNAYMYSDLSLCFGCGAIALLVGRTGHTTLLRLCAAGACLGLALASKQNLGIYLGVAALAWIWFAGSLLGATDRRSRARRIEAGAFVVGALVSFAPWLVYFAFQGVLWHMLYSGIVRPFLAYLPTSGISFFEPLRWWAFGELRGLDGFPYFVGPYWTMLMRSELPGEAWYSVYWTAGEIFSRALYTSIPLAFGAALLARLRAAVQGRLSERDRKLFAFALLSLAVFASAFPRADYYHIISVYPLVLLLLFALRRPMIDDRMHPQARSSASLLEAGAVALLLVGTGVLSLAYRSQLTYRMTLPRADIYVSPKNAWIESVVKFIADEVAPGERLFVYGHEASYYFLTGRFYVWPFLQLYPGQAGADQGEALGQLLLSKPPKLIVRGMLNWPGVPQLGTYAPILHEYIGSHFEPDERVFKRYPPRVGSEPPAWMTSVLRPREVNPIGSQSNSNR